MPATATQPQARRVRAFLFPRRAMPETTPERTEP